MLQIGFAIKDFHNDFFHEGKLYRSRKCTLSLWLFHIRTTWFLVNKSFIVQTAHKYDITRIDSSHHLNTFSFFLLLPLKILKFGSLMSLHGLYLT